jgi:SAM-dependent methyltransferase
MSWRAFWDGDHSIYVSARHKELHYARIGADIAALLPKGGAVMDYACGEALSAPSIAAELHRLYLYDAAPSVIAKARARFAGEPKITALDDAGLAALPEGALDAVVVNSLLQYVEKPDFEGLLNLFARKLKPGGRLILGDVIPPNVATIQDVTALLRFAAEGGFTLAAVAGLAKTFFSPYRKLRTDNPLVSYEPDEMLGLLGEHGFFGARADKNIGHNPARMTFVARRG